MEFLIKLEDPHTEDSRQLVQELYRDLKALGLPVDDPEIRKPQTTMITRGDPVTLGAIAAIAVGAGGALTVAMGKNGFLIQLAKVLEKYVDRNVEIDFSDDGNIKRIKGSAAEIRKIMDNQLTKMSDK
ncbi:hypothetical protein [Sessilibacter corallicola]|uniref:hypothetical protein n=1 Tax=Sessilibacter corallicola TaxID=2904075 RepID=UPI001E5D7F55|nr:hypothetical protein [Sessilibacter corallicola]MCE2027039.1 hypothetical protein [Sessilibacter corallicola]